MAIVFKVALSCIERAGKQPRCKVEARLACALLKVHEQLGLPDLLLAILVSSGATECEL